MRSQTHFIPNFDMHSVLLIATLALAAASAAQAQGSSSPTVRLAPAADAIPQNRTSTQEVDAAFNRADTNRDGKLTRQESERFPAVAQRFDQIDVNQDAFISREEFNKAAGS